MHLFFSPFFNLLVSVVVKKSVTFCISFRCVPVGNYNRHQDAAGALVGFCLLVPCKLKHLFPNEQGVKSGFVRLSLSGEPFMNDQPSVHQPAVQFLCH